MAMSLWLRFFGPPCSLDVFYAGMHLSISAPRIESTSTAGFYQPESYIVKVNVHLFVMPKSSLVTLPQ